MPPSLRIIPWKGPATLTAVPSFTQPVAIPDQENGPQFKARPIKHWRKQLVPNEPRGQGVQNRMNMDRPGGLSNLGSTTESNNVLCAATLPEDILKPNQGSVSSTCISPACQPAKQVIRRATTILRKNYFSDTKAYLRSRCVLYDQKLSSNPAPNVQYVAANGEELNPTDALNGPQVRLTQSCARNCQKIGQSVSGATIDKPNNRQYDTQGGVHPTARVTRLNLNTLNNPARPALPKTTPNAKLVR